MLIEEKDAKILIDPGYWSTEQNIVTGLDVLLISHEHSDHCDPESVKAIIANNPGIRIFANSGVAKVLESIHVRSELLEDGQSVEVKGVLIEAYGKDHAIIYETIPVVRNCGFFIDERFFYPGDSVETIPPKQVEILALPVSAPWMKTADSLDYARTIKPKVCFPVHDAMVKSGVFDKHPKNILPGFGIDVIIPELGKAFEV